MRRSALGALPVVSQAAQELMDYIVTPPLVQRQQEWMNDVAESLRRLEVVRGVTPDQLRDNPVFVDAVLTATQAAIRTSPVEKREALRNAVLNARG